MNVQTAYHLYDHVNVAGRLNDVWLTPSVLMARAELETTRLTHRLNQRPRISSLPRRTVNTVVDSAQIAWAAGQSQLGAFLTFQRGLPILWADILPIPAFGGLRALAPLYAAGEMLVGRGHHQDMPAPDTGSGVVDTWLQHQDKWSRHGALGFVLEALPLRGAARLQATGYNNLATACVLGAVLGRSLLQVPRLAIAGAALLNEATKAVIGMAVVFVGVMVLDGLYSVAYGAASLAGYNQHRVDRTLEARVDAYQLVHWAGNTLAPPVRGDDQTVDSGGPGVHQRVQNRTSSLLRRLQGFMELDAAPDAEFFRVVDGIAEDLRRYCSTQPDDAALRGGLALIKSFLLQTWDEQQVSAFDPPELAERVSQTSLAPQTP